MAHVTAQQLREHLGSRRFLELADLDGDGSVDSEELAALEAALSRAESELASHTGTKYAKLKDEDVTPALLGHLVDTTAYYLSSTGDVISEEVIRRHKESVMWAKAVGKSKAQLGSESGEDFTTRVPSVRRRGPDREFTIAKTEGLL